MLSRVGLYAASSSCRRHRQRVTTGSLVAATSLVGLTACNKCNTQLDNGAALTFTNKSELVVPTLEAAVRASRLVSTVILMVYEYQSAKTCAKWFPDTVNPKRLQLEDDVQQARQKLEEAQISYTTPTPAELIAQSGKTREEFVLAQKQDVHAAAERLSKKEEELVLVGDPKRNVHTKAANRLLHLCRTNGGTYIKIGQHLANLDYLIPQEYIEVLSSLFDNSPQSTYEDVCQVIKEDLGTYPHELFDSFEEQPIASASLAQVHVAYDRRTGRKLAIKVQHRGLRETSSGDLFALTTVVHTMERLFKGFSWGWIADEIAPQLPKELDFLNEGRNAERAAKFIKTTGLPCVVPQVMWGESSSRVLCMEFEEGFKATDLEAIQKAGLNRRDVAILVSSVFSSQVFMPHAPIHCDPHAANVLIRSNKGKPEMVLVDHGLYKDIDDDFRICYANLWRSLMLADLDGIKASCKNLGVEEMYTLLAAILTSRPYDEIMERAKTGQLSANIKDSKSDKAMIAGYAQHFLGDIIEILGTIPRQMLLLLKMNDCLRHIDFALGSPTNTLIISGKYASEAVYKDTAVSSKSWSVKLDAWMDYMRVMFRIRIHDFVVWWIDATTSSSSRLAP